MDFFHQVREFDFCLQSFLPSVLLRTVHMCSYCAFLSVLEFIMRQLKLFNNFATICCHKILVNFRFCPFLNLSVVSSFCIINDRSDWLLMGH